MKAETPLLVERMMKFMPWTVQPSDSVAHARALLDEHRINHLPVLAKEQPGRNRQHAGSAREQAAAKGARDQARP